MHAADKPKRTGLRLRLAWALLAVAVVGFLALSTVGVSSAVRCTACHSGSGFRKATEASAHAKVDCRSCHMARGATGKVAFVLQEPLHTLFPPGHTARREAAAVPNARCVECHATALHGVSQSNGIRIKHSACASGASCTECHSAVAHGNATPWVRSYDMDTCVACHAASANVACDLCHTGRRATARVSSASFAVTHGRNWRTTHGMGDVATCTVCHKASDCRECHGAGVPHEAKFVEVHAEYATGSNARCSTCHEAAFCLDCHGTKMPHSTRFSRNHAKASKDDPQLCERCHDGKDCTDCHLKHVHPGGAVGTSVSVEGAQR